MTVSLEPVTKASNELKEMLNKAIAGELQATIQYMWQHVEIAGVKGIAVQDKFEETAIDEMKHAERIAESSGTLEVHQLPSPTPLKLAKASRNIWSLTLRRRQTPLYCTSKLWIRL